MSSEILLEFIDATNRAFGSIEDGIIGGAALAAYGSTRATSDLDIIVPQSVAEVVEGHLLSKGMVRTAKGGIGYVASDGGCYGIDITSDRAISQPFSASQDTQITARSKARLANMSFLLNSKAYSYMTRIGPGMMEKKRNDAADILFIIAYLKRQRTKVSQKECR
ncbi:uncharacterized protein BDZ99DRAFT_469699 [Mytilinidion resinicola]|uniref:Nucleotidyl transferase n=1 Tax=Mytilinidion resinicola TaxID=574789 RepID=A0A6A6Y045_9PEZI|nr:uncharacterized protein BDZ99DRAFT_469699 [Mytilinidion resinicola]KAF2801374.1 hypothetical protein BDZ99DRAFT_469699 [Mytilinidion resinicola]